MAAGITACLLPTWMRCVQIISTWVFLFTVLSTFFFCNRHASECHQLSTNGKEWHCWDRTGIKRPMLQDTLLIYSWRNVCVCVYLKDRACGDDGTAMVASTRACVACRILHVWSDNSCLGRHHTGTTPCILLYYWLRKFYWVKLLSTLLCCSIVHCTRNIVCFFNTV